ncbi:hypothetical protein VNO77_13257 [Canavalia gladiata]|uniref:Uncharacterized protein n=1 Tax=Canavalia gladiata TaxID=3824 RepID=A0AAN9LX61_CANGL
MIRSLLQPNIPRPMMQQSMVMSQPGSNLFSYASQQVIAASQTLRSLQLPPQAMPSSRSINTEMARLPAPPIHQKEMEVSPIDGTKPYINTLEQPINNEFINWADLNGDKLDLTLRL